MKIKCYKCNHEWEYKGKSKNYITCPDCYRKIRIIINERRLKTNGTNFRTTKS
jgi:Zn finger protein HypA/HybF involved in hydrogenase expression